MFICCTLYFGIPAVKELSVMTWNRPFLNALNQNNKHNSLDLSSNILFLLSNQLQTSLLCLYFIAFYGYDAYLVTIGLACVDPLMY